MPYALGLFKKSDQDKSSENDREIALQNTHIWHLGHNVVLCLLHKGGMHGQGGILRSTEKLGQDPEADGPAPRDVTQGRTEL